MDIYYIIYLLQCKQVSNDIIPNIIQYYDIYNYKHYFKEQVLSMITYHFIDLRLYKTLNLYKYPSGLTIQLCEKYNSFTDYFYDKQNKLSKYQGKLPRQPDTTCSFHYFYEYPAM